MDITELKEKLSDIHRMGYVVSLRKGNTGIGYTLETLLGVAENNLRDPDFGHIELKETGLSVAENNLRDPDFGHIELKSRRMTSTSLLTLFTFNYSIWKIEQAALIQQYGYHKDGRWALYTTVKSKPNNRGFYIKKTTVSDKVFVLISSSTRAFSTREILSRISAGESAEKCGFVSRRFSETNRYPVALLLKATGALFRKHQKSVFGKVRFCLRRFPNRTLPF